MTCGGGPGRYQEFLKEKLVILIFLPTLIGTLSNHQMSLQNISLRYLYYFAIIPFCLTCTMWPNYPVTAQVETAFKLRQGSKNLPSCAHILHKALNLVISCCGLGEHGGEMYQNS